MIESTRDVINSKYKKLFYNSIACLDVQVERIGSKRGTKGARSEPAPAPIQSSDATENGVKLVKPVVVRTNTK